MGSAGEPLSLLEPMIRQAANLGADIVVTPECALSGYAVHIDRPIDWEAFLAACETIHGDRVRKLAGLADELSVYLALGFAEKRDERRLNTCALFGRDGTLVGTYSKTHLGYAAQNIERKLFDPGDSLPVFQTDVGTVGMLICMDRYFPQAAEVLASKGAEIVLMPSASNLRRREMLQHPDGHSPERCHKEFMFRTRAMDCAVVWAEAHAYKSLIVDQQGRIAARGNYLSPDDEVVIATVPLLDRAALRALYEHCKRPDLY